MLPSIRLLLARFSHRETYTTSATSAIAIPQSSIALPMLQPDSCLAFLSWKRRLKKRRNDRKKTSTGPPLTLRRRMVWAAGVDVTPISAMWKAKRAAALQSGWKSQEAGHRHDRRELIAINSRMRNGRRRPGLRYNSPIMNNVAKSKDWSVGDQDRNKRASWPARDASHGSCRRGSRIPRSA